MKKIKHITIFAILLLITFISVELVFTKNEKTISSERITNNNMATSESEEEGIRSSVIYMPVGSETYLDIKTPLYNLGYYVSGYGWYETFILENSLQTTSTNSDVATLSAIPLPSSGSIKTSYRATITAGDTPGTVVLSAIYNAKSKMNTSTYLYGFSNIVDDFIVHVYDPETITIQAGDKYDFKYPQQAVTDFNGGSLLRIVPTLEDSTNFEVIKPGGNLNDPIPSGQVQFTVEAKTPNTNTIVVSEAIFAKNVTIDPTGSGIHTQNTLSYIVHNYKANIKVENSAKTFTITYTDGVEGVTVFPDQGYEGLKESDKTPAFSETESGKTQTLPDGTIIPLREGYTFMGWKLNSILLEPLGIIHETIQPADANENGEIVYTATWLKNEEPKKITNIEKNLIKSEKEIPAELKNSLSQKITYPNIEGKIIIPYQGEVTLLYKITIKGDNGVKYKVTDTNAKWVYGSPMEGVIENSNKEEIYVTKKFTANDIKEDGKLENTATITPGKGNESSSSSTETTLAEEEKPNEGENNNSDNSNIPENPENSDNKSENITNEKNPVTTDNILIIIIALIISSISIIFFVIKKKKFN